MLLFYLFVLVLVNFCSGNFIVENLMDGILRDGKAGECHTQVKEIDFTTEVKMFDSSSKLIPSGVLGGNFYDLGFYDECLSISDDSREVYGKYCLASLTIDEFIKMTNTTSRDYTDTLMNMTQQTLKEFENSNSLIEIKILLQQYEGIAQFGICIPDKCSSDDIHNVIPVKIDESKCYTKFTNDTKTTSASIALGIIYAFLFIALVSTIYDIVITYNDKKVHPILTSFSLLTNGRKLMKSSKNPDQLHCLSGLRAIMMMWVVLGHTYFNFPYSSSTDNLLVDFKKWQDDPINMFIISATLSVDTFFTIGGLLTVYVFMKMPNERLMSSFKKVPLQYLHRYLRLTPAYGMMILIYGSGLIKYISDGPKWSHINSSVNYCSEHWWLALLYAQNYLKSTEICITQSWYLSVDFQLFLVTPFLLIPLKRWPRQVLPVLYILTIIGMIPPFIIGYSNKISGVGIGSVATQFSEDYYFRTYTRFSTYTIGMITGYYIFKLKNGKPLILKNRTVLLLWFVSVAGLLFCIFDGFKFIKNSKNEWLDGLYMGVNRSAWSTAMSLLIVLCCTGYGGPVNKFLSLPIFQIIGKLSYSMYLIHFIVILTIDLSSRTVVHFSNFVAISQFFTFFIITLSISVLYSLIFESPMITIEKMIFTCDKRKNPTLNGKV